VGSTWQLRALVRSDRRSGDGKLSLALQNCDTISTAQVNTRAVTPHRFQHTAMTVTAG